jgi:hypothetical protein
MAINGYNLPSLASVPLQGLHVDPTDLMSPPLAHAQVFLPLAKAAADTAALICMEREPLGAFHLVESHVYAYDPCRQLDTEP